MIEKVRTTVTDVNGTTHYTYTPRHRLSSVTWPNGLSLNYGYDAAGNRTSLTTAAQSISYTYDDLNRLSTVTPTLGGGASYTYDAVGNRDTLTHANGVATTYVYNPRNQLTTLTTTRPGNVIEQKFAYTLDASGLRLGVLETTGANVLASQATYTYDPLNAPITPTPAQIADLPPLVDPVPSAAATSQSALSADTSVANGSGTGPLPGPAPDAAPQSGGGN